MRGIAPGLLPVVFSMVNRIAFTWKCSMETAKGPNMNVPELTDDEALILEVIEALGGEVQTGALRVLGSDIRLRAPLVLTELAERGLLLESAAGRHALSDAGRRALTARYQERARILTPWQRKHLSETARTLPHGVEAVRSDMPRRNRVSDSSMGHFGA